MTASSLQAQVLQALKRFCSFPVGHPTDVEIDDIVADVVAHEAATGSAAYQTDVESIAASRVPGTRFLRMDGLDFHDITSLLMLIRARAQQSATGR